MKKLLNYALIAVASSGIAQTTWNLDPSHSKVQFSVTHMMISETEGNFKVFSGKAITSKDDFSDASIDFTADVNSGYLINTSTSAITVLLPPTPPIGSKFSYIDLVGTFNTNNFTIDPNGNNFYGTMQQYLASSLNESGTLIYTGATYGWKFLEISPSI